jgi:hypothetical protein
MIRGVPCDPGQGRRGEAIIPGIVDENPVKPNKGGGGPTVGPGELSIPKRKFDDTNGINSIVEHVSLTGGEVCIIPVRRVAG